MSGEKTKSGGRLSILITQKKTTSIEKTSSSRKDIRILSSCKKKAAAKKEIEVHDTRHSAKDEVERKMPQQRQKQKAHLSTLQRMRPKEAPRSAAAKQAIYGVVLLISSIDVRTGGRLHPVEVTTKRNPVSVIRHAHTHS